MKVEVASLNLFFLQSTPAPPIIIPMKKQPFRPKLQNILRWFVPIAATLAFAAWMYISPEGALGKLDAIGYAVCHRIDARSFQIDERQLPLCARCTGEFYAAGAGLIFQVFVSGKKSRMPSRGILAAFVLFFLAFGLDGGNSYLYLLKQTSRGALDHIPNLYIPNNMLRLFTGSGMGIVLAAMLYPVVNQTLWRTLDDRPTLEWKSLGILISLVIGINLLILTDSPMALYPIAYLSALGTLSLLVIVFSMLWIMLMRQENTFEHPRELWLAALSGFTLAMLMLLSIDLFRLQLTGTWGGFPGMG